MLIIRGMKFCAKKYFGAVGVKLSCLQLCEDSRGEEGVVCSMSGG